MESVWVIHAASLANFMPHSKLSWQEKKDTAKLQSESKVKKAQIEQAELATKEASERRDAAVSIIGNYVHDSVPVSQDEVQHYTLGRGATSLFSVIRRILLHTGILLRLGCMWSLVI